MAKHGASRHKNYAGLDRSEVLVTYEGMLMEREEIKAGYRKAKEL